jgi:hypothetical protein
VIGTVTIVGMLFSTGIAIFLVPALFVSIGRLSRGRRTDNAVAQSPQGARAPVVSGPLAVGGEAR